MTTTPDLGIPELAQSQANPDITHNEALVLIQALLNGVINRTTETPPVSPTEGDAYIVGDGSPAASGAWAGRANSVAIYWGGAWRFVPGNDDSGTPITMGARQEGLRLFDRSTQEYVIWAGSPLSWVPFSIPVQAVDVSFTPTGSIAATNVQAAINELDTEKVARAGGTMTGGLTIAATPALSVGTASSFSNAQVVNIQNAAGVATFLTVVGDGATGAYTIRRNSADATGPDNIFTKGRGSVAAPGQTLAADLLGRNIYQGYDNGGTPTARQAARNYVDLISNITTTSAEGRYRWEACASGSLSMTDLARLDVANGLSMFGANPVIDQDRVFRTRAYTVATLPANVAGKIAHVTDATLGITAGIGLAPTGGGANVVPVFNDGAGWRII